ncbi:MAG: TolB family protein [Janthinobacterium lividum]
MTTFWLLLVLLSVGSACHADRDIVYSARYYTLPGSHRTSHFHIYRINPDGTGRTQLTFGLDEEFPQWSADGNQITFFAYHQMAPFVTLCTMDADGGRKRVLKILPPGIERPEPPTVAGYRLEDVDTENAASERHILISLKTGQRLTIRADDDTYPELLPMPGRHLIYADNRHNSTVGTDYAFYRLNPDNGNLHYLTEGQFLAWAPDGSHFCTAPGRDTTPYEKRKEPYPVQYFGQTDARYRSVWFAPLYVRAAAGGPMKQITPRLSYVTGADWRKVK